MRYSLPAVIFSAFSLLSAGALAQNVEVNSTDWAGLSQQERELITTILTESKLLPVGVEIVPSERAPPSEEILAEMDAASPEAAGNTLQVNAAEWNSLSQQEREQITTILTESKLLPVGVEIAPSRGAQPSQEIIAQTEQATQLPETAQEAAQCFVRDRNGRETPFECPPGIARGAEPEFSIPGLGTLKKRICRAGCTAAAAAAGAACSIVSGPVIPVCVAGVERGLKFCTSRC